MAVEPLAHTMAESAALLNVSLSQLWILVRDDRLVSYKVGKRRYISRAELERFVKENEEAASRQVKVKEQ